MKRTISLIAVLILTTTAFSADMPTKKDFTNSISMKFIRAGPSSFAMGKSNNHNPAIAECQNGDLLAIWYSCDSEKDRALTVVGSRLVWGTSQWQDAAPFFDAPDRNAETRNGKLTSFGFKSTERQGYMSACQGTNGIIHVISSWNHYAFNIKWLETLPPEKPVK